VALAALLVALIIWPENVQSAQAASFTVNSTTDAIDANPGDGVCATASLPGEGVRCTLRAAIQEANDLPGGPHTVTVPAGTFVLTIPGANEDLGATGDLDVRSAMTIVGAGASQTILDGNRLDRVVDVNSIFGALSLLDVTVRNGRASGDFVGGMGGGIQSRSFQSLASLTLTRVTVSSNEAQSSGGGISGKGVVEDSIITGNSAGSGGSVGDGGGISGWFTIRRSTISANTTAGSGGGIWGSSAILEDSLITENRAGTGGGVEGSLSIRRTVISSNVARFGGGIRAAATIEESLITANTATEDGGGIEMAYGGLGLRNSTVSGNSTGRSGGGVSVNSGCITRTGPCITASVRNVTVVENGAPVASGVRINASTSAPPPRFAGTIIANNRGSANCSVAGPFTSGGYNLSNDASCGFTGTGDLQWVNPRLGPLADNGGPTRTHALLLGSPAIDAGPPTVAGPVSDCPAIDQRGQPRSVDGNLDGAARCDIGAFEAPPPPPGCAPRPPMQVQATPVGSGRLQVTVSATANSGFANALQSITWDRLDNATVTLVGGGPVSPGQQTTLPAGAQTLTFLVGRVATGQAATVHFTVTDACGTWPTFVGGGPTAF